MSSIIPEAGSPDISSALFIKLSITEQSVTTVYTFSNSYKEETIDGVVYLPMGGLLNITAKSRDLSVTSGQTTISLSGIGGENIALVLGSNVKGSIVEIYRGFYDENDLLTNVYKRYTGLVTNYTVAEELILDDMPQNNFVVTIGVATYKEILENRVAGRKTNQNSWQRFDQNDSSMNNVQGLLNQVFNFGLDANAQQSGNNGRGIAGGGSSVNEGTNVNFL